METKKTALKTAGNYKKSEAINFAPEKNTSKTTRVDPDKVTLDTAANVKAEETQNPTPTKEAIKAKDLFKTIKESIHGETDRTVNEEDGERKVKLCDWAIPEASKKKNCDPVDRNCDKYNVE